MSKIVLRPKRRMFMGVKLSDSESVTYTRLKGFTTLTENKNPTEYTRKYVDEYFEETDIVGVSTSFDFTFDMIDDDEALSDIAAIIDGEMLGEDAVRSFVSVDFNKPASGGGYEAVERKMSIVGSTIGDGSEALTYSGAFRVKTEKIIGTATIATPEGATDETVKTITFTPLQD